MAKKDVTDTVDIFFGAGRKAPKSDVEKEIAAEIDQLASELKELQAGAKTIAKQPVATPQATQAPIPKQERERVSFVLPAEQAEFLKNYKYCRALMDGDPQYTMTEALIEAIELLRKHSEYEVFERPDFVRVREKKPRR